MSTVDATDLALVFVITRPPYEKHSVIQTFVKTQFYATTSAKHDYNQRQRIIALLSGGIAVGRSRWNERLVQWETDRWQTAMQNNTWSSMTPVGWVQPLTIASRLCGSGQPEHLDQAKAILGRIVEAFPHVPQPWEDLILVCLNQEQTDESSETLLQAGRVIAPTEELMCRFGRIEKELGLTHFSNENWSAAVYHFERAFDYYRQASPDVRGPLPGDQHVLDPPAAIRRRASPRPP